MTLDPHSLKKLQELRRELPKELPKPHVSSEKENQLNKNLHPIETEEDPNTLFKKLMQVSPDGNVPKHMLTRLKEVESKNLHQDINESTINSKIQAKKKGNFADQVRKQEKDQENSLYTSFKRLLLEEED